MKNNFIKKASCLLITMLSLNLLMGCNKNTPSSDEEVVVEEPVLTLKEVKNNAISSINSHVNKDDYYSADLEMIDSIIDQYVTLISECKNKDTINEYLITCLEELDKIKTKSDIYEEYEEEINSTDYYEYNYMDYQKEYNVLLVGSSYIYYNDSDILLENILLDRGYNANVDSITKGSATLEDFASSTNSLNTTLKNKLSTTTYDYVILEELSTRPIKNYDLFDKAVGDLKTLINSYSSSTEIILMEVWSRDERCDWYNDNEYSYDELLTGVLNAVNNVATKYNLRVTYPGLSFDKVYKDNSTSIDLYYSDYTHPSIYGSYLSALSMFYSLTYEDPINVTYYPTNFVASSKPSGTYSISEEDANYLKNSVVRFDDRMLSIDSISVLVWMSGSGANALYYSYEELDEIKTRFLKRYKKAIFRVHGILKGGVNDVYNAYQKFNYDIVLGGGNIDTDCQIPLNDAENYKKAKLGIGWTSNTKRYIGITSTCLNLDSAYKLRDLLINEKIELTDYKNVLFIGNSYTFYNDMPIMFKNICASMGINVKTYKVTEGGRYLEDYQDSNDSYTIELVDKLNTIKFDYIVIQEQSSCPASSYSKYKNGFDIVNNYINQSELNANSQRIIYGTWARNINNSYYQTHYTTYNSSDAYKKMTIDLFSSFINIANLYNYKVSNCGIGFYEAFVKYPEMNMYHTDYTHPSGRASYMIALIHAATMFNINPLSVTYVPNFTYFYEGNAACVMPTEEEATKLRLCAYNAWSYNYNTYFN